MNFKTFITESNKEPVVVGFEREKDPVHDRMEDFITIEYKGETYRIVQVFSFHKSPKPYKKPSILLLNTGLQRYIDRTDGKAKGFSYIDLKPPRRTLPGGDFYTDLIDRKLNLSREEYEVLKLGVMSQFDRDRYIKKFSLGMKPETAEHFGDIIGKLRE